MNEQKIKAQFAEEEEAGGRKIALIRLVAVVLFYADELLNFHVLRVVEPHIHERTVFILYIWLVFAGAAWYSAWRARVYRPWMKYLTAATDAFLLTFIIIALEAHGGPLISLYFLLIAQSSLRYSRDSALFAGGLSVAGYAAVWLDSQSNPRVSPVPFYVGGIQVLAMAVMAFTSGYVVKKLRGLVFKFSDSLVRRELAESALQRYVSHQVARRILESPDGGAAMQAGRRAHVAILISDIRGFTPLSEGMAPEKLVALLNAYFSRMVDVVFRHDGTLDKFVGDALIVVFNDPLEVENPERRAAECALEMQAEIKKFNAAQAAAGGRELGVGIGLHCGPVVAGGIGSQSRMDYTVIGDTVNFASRLQGKAPAGAIHVSAALKARTQEVFNYRSLGKSEFKGYSEAAEVYELVQP
jgi:adenylate cyclase